MGKRFIFSKGTGLLCAAASAALIFAGCAGTGTSGIYRVYYTYGNGSGLKFENIKAEAEGGNALAYELLERMNSPKKSDSFIVIKPNDVEITDVRTQDDKVIVSFNDKYTEMDHITEIFYRTAVVKTLSQINGINKIDFETNGNIIELQDGLRLCDMESSMYIDDNDTAIAGTDWIPIYLYYTDEKGEKLIRTRTNVPYNSDVSLESLIVSKLLSGPVEAGLYPVLPENTDVLGVTVTNDTCYVNFNEDFVTGLVNAGGDLPIYSVVNSLCELDGINNVRIMINGSSDVMFHEVTSLDRDFQYDASLVEGDIL